MNHYGASLILRARGYARHGCAGRDAEKDVLRLERLADRLEKILDARRRLLRRQGAR